jgi:dTDP-4-amino-4,6-dideoxygalactose transaminase
MGDIGVFSFYPGKNLGAYGEGGAAVTRDVEYARMMRVLRDWGQEQKYEHRFKGFNYRMDAIQGAILRVKLRHLEAWTEARRSRAVRYDRRLGSAPVQLPAARPQSRHVYHLYTVRTAERDRHRRALLERGIQTAIHYPTPIHLQRAHADLGYASGDFPHSERAALEVLSLPMFAELTDAQVDEVASVMASPAREPIRP